MEFHCEPYFHAAKTLLDKIDQDQRHFLEQLQVSVDKAFLNYNFAPTKLRRNLAILGLLQKRILGLCHPSYDKLLPWYSQYFNDTRAGRHNKQLYGHWLEVTQHRTLFRNSIFGMIDIYNNLPQYVVDAQSVSYFQRLLTKMAKARSEPGEVEWESSFADVLVLTSMDQYFMQMLDTICQY